MKVVALEENKSFSKTYKNEHGLSFYLETRKHKIIFDLGPNHAFIDNSKKNEN